MRRAQRDIEEHGEILHLKTDRGADAVRKNPSVEIEADAADRCIRLLSICGIDLRSRSALSLGKTEEEYDQFEELYRRRRTPPPGLA